LLYFENPSNERAARLGRTMLESSINPKAEKCIESLPSGAVCVGDINIFSRLLTS
jgi:hypothetical protein